MSALTLLSTTNLPPENESCTSISLYQMDEETSYVVGLLRRGPFNEYPAEDLKIVNDLYYDGISTYEEYIMDLLDLYEEPDYAVLPGGLYHRYTVEIIRDVAAVAETIALNV